jgi:hypothetical protein
VYLPHMAPESRYGGGMLRSAGVLGAGGGGAAVAAVADGVARVEVTLARGRSPISDRFHPAPLRASGAVIDNVVAIPVDRTGVDTVVVHQTWRGPDGRAVAEIDCPEDGC